MAEEINASQYGAEDGGMGGPGAPTPLSALEVCTLITISVRAGLTGHCRA